MPSFEALDENWNSFSSDTLKGKPTVIFFYPKDNTAGCTKEVCAFRDNYEEFNVHSANIIGISRDKPDSHLDFKSKHDLPFPLLSDDGTLRELFGLKPAILGLIPSRETFIFDEEGKLVDHFANQIRPTKHVDQALQVLAELT